MLLHYAVLSFLTCIARVAAGLAASNIALAYKCEPTPTAVCFINAIKLEDPDAEFRLENQADKKTLNLKAGAIEALRMKHCQSLSKFEKILIGKVGLKELCIATSFVQVNAEHNNIKQLHVVGTEAVPYRLEKLRLNDNRLESVQDICKFNALKELHLERNFLSTLDMACFKQMAQLKKLHLAYNRLNTITSTSAELNLPALSFVGLQNNTLTELFLHKWSLPALEVLELSFNNLTNVRGLENLQMLSDISLARNRWQCDELDQMLETLENNGVRLKDGDQNCSAIRNSTICCTYEQQDSENTLLDELNKFTMLKERYDELETKVSDMVKSEVLRFDNKIQKLVLTRTQEKAPVDDENTEKPGDGDEPSNTGNPPAEGAECVCSKDSMDKLEELLQALETKINENDVKLQALLANESHFSFMTTVTKHEFRTAVKRGENKLKELNSMLEMLRSHITQKRH